MNTPPFLADCPAPLVSSDRSVSVPVEASIEDLHDDQRESSEEFVQTDAKTVDSSSALEEKLDQELRYHKHGSYNCMNQSDAASCLHPNSSNPFLQNLSPSDHAITQPDQHRPLNVSSVHSWSKASQEESWRHPTFGHYPSTNSFTHGLSQLSATASTSSLPQFNQQHPNSHYDRQQSWPTYPVADTSAPDISPGHLLAPSKSSLLQDPGTRTNMSVL